MNQRIKILSPEDKWDAGSTQCRST